MQDTLQTVIGTITSQPKAKRYHGAGLPPFVFEYDDETGFWMMSIPDAGFGPHVLTDVPFDNAHEALVWTVAQWTLCEQYPDWPCAMVLNGTSYPETLGRVRDICRETYGPIQ